MLYFHSMSREKIAEGWEHEVFLSKKPGWVLKRPKKSILRVNSALGYGTAKIREEISEGQSIAYGSEIMSVPETRVFDTKKIFRYGKEGYIIVQRYVPEDGSISGLRDKLFSEGKKFLVDQYEVDSRNFGSNQGSVYWYDPSHGYHRILDRFPIISYKVFIPLKARLVRLIKGMQ